MRLRRTPKRLSVWCLGAALGLLSVLAVALLAPPMAGQAPTLSRRAITELAEVSPKVMVVFLDGAADWLVDDYLARGVLPANGALARLARTGARAEYMVPPDASMTAPAHYTMLTGAYPERHSIVSNTFHLAGDPISRSTRGFDAPVRAETLWEAARRQGKRVLCVAAFADGTTPERSCDLTLAYGQRAGPAAVVTLTPSSQQQQNWNLGGERFEHVRHLQATADSPAPLVFQLDRGEALTVHALAADMVFDTAERYDTLLMDFDRDLENGYAARLHAGEWAAVVLPARGDPVEGSPATIGSWVKLLDLAEDLSRTRLYLGAPHHNRGAPADYVLAIEAALGFWPGDPDETNLNRGLIDAQTWGEQAERLSNYIRAAALFSLRRYDFELLLTYQPLVDEVEHRFLLVDPRQASYNDEGGAKRARFTHYVKWSYRTVDGNLRRVMEAAPADTHFIVASDHGMVPVHTRVAINAWLAQAGFRVARDDTTEVRAYTSGSTAHIYVNLAGRESGGVLPKKKLPQFVRRIVGACRALRDPATQEPIFDRVLTRAELDSVRLGHPRTAGDVWVNARPGYRLTGRIEPLEPVLEPETTDIATHGYVGTTRQVQAIFFAAGPKIRPAVIPPMRSLDVAATVSALLGIQPPKHNQGKAVLRSLP